MVGEKNLFARVRVFYTLSHRSDVFEGNYMDLLVIQDQLSKDRALEPHRITLLNKVMSLPLIEEERVCLARLRAQGRLP